MPYDNDNSDNNGNTEQDTHYTPEFLDRLATAAGPENTTHTGGGTSGFQGTCVVTALRQGKQGQETLEVPCGTTIAQVMERIGWNWQECSIRKKTGDGPLASVTSPLETRLGPVEGEHMIIASPRVVGG